jgi:hypothetical protein
MTWYFFCQVIVDDKHERGNDQRVVGEQRKKCRTDGAK